MKLARVENDDCVMKLYIEDEFELSFDFPIRQSDVEDVVSSIVAAHSAAVKRELDAFKEEIKSKLTCPEGASTVDQIDIDAFLGREEK